MRAPAVPAIHTARRPCEFVTVPGRSSVPAPRSVRRHGTSGKRGCWVGGYAGYRTRTGALFDGAPIQPAERAVGCNLYKCGVVHERKRGIVP
eukprot:834291-Rhodomonas_salina.2